MTLDSDSDSDSGKALDLKKVEELIKGVIIDLVGINDAEYDVNKKLRLEYGLSSVEAVELIMELEDAYNITIPDSEAKKILTTQDAINYVMKNAKEAREMECE